MSRSNPTTTIVHCCTRWFEANCQDGKVFYYDREQKKKIDTQSPFCFLLLDELAVVRGWNDAAESGVVSNEVRDTRQEVFVVKTFSGLEIASGHYAMIRDKVNAAGGRYNASLYIAFRATDGQLKIGNLNLKGAALSSWTDWRKEQKKNTSLVNGKPVERIYLDKAIIIKGWKDGKKGSIEFKTPEFSLSEVKPETNDEAKALDTNQLQPYLEEYLKRRKAEAPAKHPASDEPVQESPPVENQAAPEPDRENLDADAEAAVGDDVPF